MNTLRRRFALAWLTIRAIARHPEMVLMLAKMVVIRVAIIVGCWWTGIRLDDLRPRLQILIGGDPSPPV